MLKCEKCAFTCRFKKDLKAHTVSVHHERLHPFKCDKCPREFANKCNFLKHVKVIHYNLRPFSCELCSYAAGAKQDLAKHVNSFHHKKHQVSTAPSVTQKAKLIEHVNSVHKKHTTNEVPQKKPRNSYTYKEKSDIIDQYHEFMKTNGAASYRDVVEPLGVPKTTLQRWICQKDEILARAADETRKNLKKLRPSAKHDAT